MSGCQKCHKVTAGLLLVAGILFLLVDMGIWSFWNLSWWTVLLIIVGLTGCAKSCCSDCKSMCSVTSSKKGRK